MKLVQNRRRFLTTLSSAGAAGLLIGPAPSLAQEAPPETTTVRLTMMPGDLHCAAIRGRGAAQERGFFRGQIRRRTIDGTIDDHMADLAGAQFLRFGGKPSHASIFPSANSSMGEIVGLVTQLMSFAGGLRLAGPAAVGVPRLASSPADKPSGGNWIHEINDGYRKRLR